MELTDLLTFSTVARLGGITRAAEELNTVQSNVTQRIKAMRAKAASHPIEAVGEKLRAMMPWIAKNKLVDQTRN